MSTDASTASAASDARARLDRAALAALFRPRIVTLVVFETAAGYLVERPDGVGALAWLLAGVALIAMAGCALNHLLERETDALMERTARRPLCTGAMTVRQVLALGGGMLLAGLAAVYTGCGAPATLVVLGAAVVYLAIYTPLKRRTSSNTWIGAIPGALPVLAGAAGARGEISLVAWIVFGLVFAWQLPHFFAIASMYRDDYASGGLRMLSGDDPEDVLLRWLMPLLVMLVILISLLPTVTGEASPRYGVFALVAGVAFLASAWRFRSTPERARARRVVVASVIYLPLVLAALIVDRGMAPAPIRGDTTLPVLGEVPAFTLRAEDGEPFGRDAMLGDVWVVDFIFTRCGAICPDMSARGAELVRRGLDARLMSVSVDPRHDGPEQLRAYESRFDVPAERWTLLTGEPSDVRALAEGGFKLPTDVRLDATPIEGLPDIAHSGKFALVDARARIRGYYDHDDLIELDALVRDAARLAADAP